MVNSHWSRCVAVVVSMCFFCLTGCPQQPAPPAGGKTGTATPPKDQPIESAATKESSQDNEPVKGTASTADVKAARDRIDALGSRSKYAPKEGGLLTEIVIQDGSNLKAEDLELFGKLTDLKKLQIFNCRTLNDEMAAHLSKLSGLTSLALTNSAINDATAEMIVKSFPNLTELDLSSNTNLTSGVLKILGSLSKLQRLTLIQDRINDIGAQRLSKFQDLRALDMRGNMEAGDMALDVVADLPKLSGFKHRSTAVSDAGLESLSRSQTLESLLMQDFVITNQSGASLAKLSKLSQLEVFRCQGFGSEGVLALKGMGLTRFSLRDLPNVDDMAMEVFDDLPALRRLYLHELPSVSDTGLAHLSNLKTLELLDIWTVPQMTDATVDVIASIPSLTTLTIRATAVTDAAVDKILKMPNLQTLTFKENGAVTADGLKKLSSRKWTKLDIGSSAADSGE